MRIGVKFGSLLFALLAFLLLPVSSFAQESGQLPRPWWAVDAGGGVAAEKPGFLLSSEETEFLKRKPPEAFLRSIVLPGWGQRYGGRYGRAAIFTSLEVGLWTGLILSREAWMSGKDNYTVYARQHAGVFGDKEHEYYVNIGNYANQDAYNVAKRMQRAYDEQYFGTSNWWEWDSRDNQLTFKDMRISADRHKNRIYYLIGGLVLNRVVSAIDAGRGLAKRQQEIRKKSTIQLGYDPKVGGPSLMWSGNLGF